MFVVENKSALTGQASRDLHVWYDELANIIALDATGAKFVDFRHLFSEYVR
jgi:hypothetical protein